MNRTPLGEVRFYHLELASGAADERLSLLLGDRAGEEYREAADRIAVAARFAEIKRADTLTVLVDGERLVGSGRHNLRSDIIMMLQGLHEGGVFRERGRLALVLTKLDLVEASPQHERALQGFEDLLQHARQLFGRVLPSIEPFQVAASPKLNAKLRGEGLDKLLLYWHGQPDGLVPVEFSERIHSRAFARLPALKGRAEPAHE
jgi:hypothetical protein